MIWKTPYNRYNYIKPSHDIVFVSNNIRNEGIDQRYNGSEYFDITTYEKNHVLKTLESSSYNNQQKIELLEYNSFLFNISMVYTIFSGGLYDDFNFEAF